MKNISFRDVTIGDGFWKDRQKVNSESTIYNVRDRFAERDLGRNLFVGSPFAIDFVVLRGEFRDFG